MRSVLYGGSLKGESQERLGEDPKTSTKLSDLQNIKSNNFIKEEEGEDGRGDMGKTNHFCLDLFSFFSDSIPYINR